MDQAKRLKALSIELGSPWENGYVEVFDTLWETKVLAGRWRREYNQRRPPAPEAQLPRPQALDPIP